MSELSIGFICSVEILDIFEVIAKTSFSKIAKCSTLVPVERNIDLTEAMLSWCDEWRHHYDEQNRKDEAKDEANDAMNLNRDFVGSGFDEMQYELHAPDPRTEHQRTGSGDPEGIWSLLVP